MIPVFEKYVNADSALPGLYFFPKYNAFQTFLLYTNSPDMKFMSGLKLFTGI